MGKITKQDNLHCTFCGKNQKDVKKLIAGPSVYICNECVDLCISIIKEENSSAVKELSKDIPLPKEMYNI